MTVAQLAISRHWTQPSATIQLKPYVTAYAVPLDALQHHDTLHTMNS